MPNTRKRFQLVLITILTILTAGVVYSLDPPPQQTGSDIRTDQTPLAIPEVSLLREAAQAMGQGDVQQARQQLELIAPDAAGQPYREQLRLLVDNYGQVLDQIEQQQKSTLDEYHQDLLKALDNARWRQTLLDTSLAYNAAATEEKQKQEETFRKEIQDDWLEALAQLAYHHEVAHRLNYPETLDPDLRQSIIDKALELGQSFEQKNEWLEAYARVYKYLSSLDTQSSQYEDITRRLLRRAAVTANYVPDPNEDSIPWQERRKEITDEIVYRAVGFLDHYYVNTPDYQEMALYALENCLVLAEAPKLGQTFDSINDPEKVADFRRQLQDLLDVAKKLEPDQFGSIQLLGFLGEVQKVNASSLQLPDEVIVAEFAEGAFSGLDTYTNVVWPSEVESFSKDMTQEFSGVGIEINKDEQGLLKVGSLLEDSPANRVGLDAGDTITAIDGKSTTNITLDMAVRRITGPAGTQVVLTINRDGFDKPRDFKITREKIVVQTVKGLYRDQTGQWQYIVDPDSNIAYIRLTGFTGETPERLKRIFLELKDRGIQGLILDLRYNSGGYLSGAIQIADYFLPEGSLIVSTRPDRPSELGHWDYATRDATLDTQLPMVVLINQYSASASEIVSGALKDHQRALIVGSRSFGKGSVQQIQPLRPTDAQLKLTIAYYFLPKGRRVHHDPKDKTNEDYGVEPDLKVILVGKQIEEFLKVRREASILHRNGDESSEARNWTTYSPDQVLKSDPQLQIALLTIKARLVDKTLQALVPDNLQTARNP